MSATTPTSDPTSRALIALPIIHPPSRSWSSSTATSSSSSNVASTSSATLIEYHHQEQEEQDEEEQWQPILHASSNQVVLYNPRSHALSITSSSASPSVVVTRRHRGRDHDTERWCPYCKQRLPAGFEMYEYGRSMRMNANEEHIVGGGEGEGEDNQDDDQERGRWGEGRWDHGHLGGGGGGVYDDDRDDEFESLSTDPAYHSRASDYFRLLAIANERSTGISGSSSTTPHGPYRVGGTSSSSFVQANDEPPSGSSSSSSSSSEGTTHNRRNNSTTSPDDPNNVFPSDKMAEGYFKTFFQEEYKLGMGANGSVFLCQVHITYIYL